MFDDQKLVKVEPNCAARRPGRVPYDFSEYDELLIRQDDPRVTGRIKSISAKRSGKCKDILPLQSCPCTEGADCWVTAG